MLLKEITNIRRLVKCLVSLMNSKELTSNEREDIEILIYQLIDLIE